MFQNIAVIKTALCQKGYLIPSISQENAELPHSLFTAVVLLLCFYSRFHSCETTSENVACGSKFCKKNCYASSSLLGVRIISKYLVALMNCNISKFLITCSCRTSPVFKQDEKMLKYQDAYQYKSKSQLLTQLAGLENNHSTAGNQTLENFSWLTLLIY